MLHFNFTRSSSIPNRILLCVVFLSLTLSALAGSPPAKLAGLMPKGVTHFMGEPARMQVMMYTTLLSDYPQKRGCSKSGTTPKAIEIDLKSFDIATELGKMQVQFIPSNSKKNMDVLKKQLEEVLAIWKSSGHGRAGTIKEETVKGGKIFSVSYDDVCYESENPAYHEVRMKGYLFNGKTEAMLSLTVLCDDAEARAMMIEMLDKIERTDFTDLMK